MARVLKKTLQARARRAGIKGYSKMTVAQLQKAIASAAKRKPKKKAAPKRAAVKRSSTRRKPMAARGSMTAKRSSTRRKPMGAHPEFNKYEFARNLESEIKDAILDGDITQDYEIDERINQEIDNAVIYYYESCLILIACTYYDWADNELGIEVTNVTQAAYLALYEYIYSETDVVSNLYNFFEENAE
jgi:hypothetical protein